MGAHLLRATSSIASHDHRSSNWYCVCIGSSSLPGILSPLSDSISVTSAPNRAALQIGSMVLPSVRPKWLTTSNKRSATTPMGPPRPPVIPAAWSSTSSPTRLLPYGQTTPPIPKLFDDQVLAAEFDREFSRASTGNVDFRPWKSSRSTVSAFLHRRRSTIRRRYFPAS